MNQFKSSLLRQILKNKFAPVLAIALVVGFGAQFFLGQDNAVEQIAERVIENMIGAHPGEIDFTPEEIEEQAEKELTKEAVSQAVKAKVLSEVQKKLHDIAAKADNKE